MRFLTLLRDALAALFSRPATTPYPNPKPPTSATLRGELKWDPTACTGCQLCVKDCPSDALELVTIDKSNKQFVMAYDAAQCIYCGQCVQNCRFACLRMTDTAWSLATPDRHTLLNYYGDEANIQNVLGNNTETAADDPSA